MAEQVGVLHGAIELENKSGVTFEALLKHFTALDAQVAKSGQLFDQFGRTITKSADQPMAQAAQNIKVADYSMAGFGKTVAATALGMIGVGGLAQALNTVVSGVKNAVNSYLSFEVQMAKVSTLANVNGSEIEKLSKKYGMEADGLAAGLYKILPSADNVADAFKYLDAAAKIAKIGVGDLTTNLDLMDNVADAFNLNADDSVKVLDKIYAASKRDGMSIAEMTGALSHIAPVASEANIGLEEIISALTTLKQKGVPAQEAVGGLRTIMMALIDTDSKLNKFLGLDGIKSVGDFTKALETMREKGVTGASALEGLGISLKGMPGALKLLNEGWKQYNDELKKTGENVNLMDKDLKKVQGTHSASMNKILQIYKAGVRELASYWFEGADLAAKWWLMGMDRIAKGPFGGGDKLKVGPLTIEKPKESWDAGTYDKQMQAFQKGTIAYKDLIHLEEYLQKMRQNPNYANQKSNIEIDLAAIQNVIVKTKEKIELQETADKKHADFMEADAKRQKKITDAKTKEDAEAAKKEKELADKKAEAALKAIQAAEKAAKTEQERKQKVKDLADMARDAAEAEHEARVRGLNTEIDLLEYEAKNEKNNAETRLRYSIAVIDKRMELARYEEGFRLEQLEAQNTVQQELLKGDSERLAAWAKEYKATKDQIVKDTGNELDKEVHIKTEIQTTLDQTTWQRLNTNIRLNFQKWGDDLKMGVTSAWSGMTSEIIGGITEIGQRWGGMNDTWAQGLNDLSGLISNALSGNVIGMAVSAIKLIGDAIWGAGEKSKEAAEAEREAAEQSHEAANQAREAAKAFLLAAGKEDIPLMSFEGIESALATTMQELRNYTVSEGLPAYMSTVLETGAKKGLTTEQTLQDRIDYLKAAGINPEEVTRLEEILSNKQGYAFTNFKSYMEKISAYSQALAGYEPGAAPSLAAAKTYDKAIDTLNIQKNAGQITDWEYWAERKRLLDQKDPRELWKSLDALSYQRETMDVAAGLAALSGTPATTTNMPIPGPEPEIIPEGITQFDKGGVAFNEMIAKVGETPEVIMPLETFFKKIESYMGRLAIDVNVHGSSPSDIAIAGILGEQLESRFRAKGF